MFENNKYEIEEKKTVAPFTFDWFKPDNSGEMIKIIVTIFVDIYPNSDDETILQVY